MTVKHFNTRMLLGACFKGMRNQVSAKRAWPLKAWSFSLQHNFQTFIAVQSIAILSLCIPMRVIQKYDVDDTTNRQIEKCQKKPNPDPNSRIYTCSREATRINREQKCTKPHRDHRLKPTSSQKTKRNLLLSRKRT